MDGLEVWIFLAMACSITLIVVYASYLIWSCIWCCGNSVRCATCRSYLWPWQTRAKRPGCKHPVHPKCAGLSGRCAGCQRREEKALLAEWEAGERRRTRKECKAAARETVRRWKKEGEERMLEEECE